MEFQPIQDTIEFSLVAERTVTNDTVKLTASMSCTVMPGVTEDTLKTNIRGVLTNFIPNVEWQLSGLTRSSDPSGVEKLALTATVRVHESEYYALDERSRNASVSGVRITHVNADTSPPPKMVEEAEGALRLMLLQKAGKQQYDINQQLNANYRLGNVEFGNGVDSINNRHGQMLLAASTYSHSGGGPVGGAAAEVIGNTVKLTMSAMVTLSQNAR